MLPDEIISEILSPALKVPEELFSSTSDDSPFSNYTPSTSAYLLVCKDWFRVATPLLYNVVVLRSKSQANALETVLRSNPDFGRFIKMLRVEGGYGAAMYTILKSAPNVTDLVVSLSIWSPDSTDGLRKGLPLLNPRRVIVIDPYVPKPAVNKQRNALKATLFDCILSWSDLRVFGYPYGTPQQWNGHVALWLGRGQEMSELLLKTQVHTVTLGASFHPILLEFINMLGDMPSLKVLRFERPADTSLITKISEDPRLKELAKYTPEERATSPEKTFVEPDITPSLNPFVPMESASDETREIRLGLPYLYESLHLKKAAITGLLQQLAQEPQRGSYIRRIYSGFEHTFEQDSGIELLGYATNLEVLVPRFDQAQHITREALEVIGESAGHSVKELSVHLNLKKRGPLSFGKFTALRKLEIGSRSPSCPQIVLNALPDALEALHTLRITFGDALDGLLESFAVMQLPSLHTLALPVYFDEEGMSGRNKFMNVHGGKLLHITAFDMGNFGVLDLCPNLIDLELNMLYLDGLVTSKPHNSLAKIVVTERLDSDLEGKDINDMLPALREIHVTELEWPKTERQIAKSALVPFAESLLARNVKLIGSEGRQWVPRLKKGRSRKATSKS
ncbi:hypothetical protein FB45DRAFT_1060982 [Roridomyces roridus]|uniref:Uncharacterized protein n=1 Tax=Roridomyces roridus TaxID=1738132 RepID=A0AAD7BM12_9AGAR|nr:hypothetical protein FB45DRAFT_1060982 [Roridomyces roridus]